ncbi:MAG: tRNA (guanosine(46)-N7)-methyltransferase TrmB [Rhodocyclaceae bacterium]|nr:MAG: tRNA (guanosine(46)-N7)-methyltransferase TrmB [Rhodocyclaceae bacterium]
MSEEQQTPHSDESTDQPSTPGGRLTSQSIRSFVLRQGRMSEAQHRFLDEMMPRVGLPYRPEPVDLDAVFGRKAPHIVEIGFGMGQATAQIAQVRPGDDFVGIEVHAPGVGGLCKLIDEGGLTNLRIVQHDAVEVLRDMIPEGSLAGVHIYFPDPWPKKRHHKRRLVQGPFVKLIASRLAPGGYLHCATDWEEYAHQMLEVLSAEPLLANTADGFAPKPDYRPLTKFENRGLKLGHGVWDVVFKRV